MASSEKQLREDLNGLIDRAKLQIAGDTCNEFEKLQLGLAVTTAAMVFAVLEHLQKKSHG